MDIKQSRAFLKDTIRLQMDFSTTDQAKGLPPPPIEKPVPAGVTPLSLPAPASLTCGRNVDLATAIGRRCSHRQFRAEALSLEELSFLLWATQGVRHRDLKQRMLRTVPSAGARHAFETYVAILQVQGREPGIYRYLPSTHSLVLQSSVPDLGDRLSEGCLDQAFVGTSAAVFVWAVIPYRMEWRYGLAAHRVIPMDAGHVCQNLYLACEGIGAGTCGVAAFHQQLMDALLQIDGEDEFTIYLAPVGKVDPPAA